MKLSVTTANNSTLNRYNIHSIGKSNDSICLLSCSATDTFEIYSPSHHYLPSNRLQTNEGIMGEVIFTSIFIILFAFIRLRGKDLLYNLLHTVTKRKKAEIILNEGISSNLIFYFLSLCLSFSILSVFISYLSWHNFLTYYSFYIFISLLLFHFLLLILIRFFAWIFNAKMPANEIIVNLWTYHILMGLFVSPFVISLFFIHNYAIIPLIKIVIFGLAILLIVKIIRWVVILFSYRVSILYMILYLCALEIMPLLILYKVVA